MKPASILAACAAVLVLLLIIPGGCGSGRIGTVQPDDFVVSVPGMH